MFIDTENMTKEQKREIEKQLAKLGASYITEENFNLFAYKEKIKSEHKKITKKTNDLNAKSLNLAVMAALHNRFSNFETELGFYYRNSIELKLGSFGIDYRTGESILEVLDKEMESEEIEAVLNLIANEIEMDLDLDLIKKNTEILIDSTQDKITRIF